VEIQATKTGGDTNISTVTLVDALVYLLRNTNISTVTLADALVYLLAQHKY
jgi:hypothetical protein